MSVIINEYSDNLVRRFKFEKNRLLGILPKTIKIEHVGSSAVSIGGKNIVDILIGVKNREEMKAVGNILSHNGYFEGNDSHSDRIFLASSQEETGDSDFHIHICPISESSYRDMLVLRDFLRNNPPKAREYFQKKHEFAKLADFDRKKYRSLKSKYVSKLLIEAKNKPHE